jgi:adenosylhomocysteine nucleosidase
MAEEFTLLSRHLSQPRTTTIGPRTFFEGSIGGREVVLVCSRIGKVAAATTVTTLIASFGVDAVLCTGVAGGIDHHVSIGDIVVAREDAMASPHATSSWHLLWLLSKPPVVLLR